MRSENGPLVPQSESDSGVEEGEKGVREGRPSRLCMYLVTCYTPDCVCVNTEDRYFAQGTHNRDME